MSNLITIEQFEAAQRIHNFIPWLACKHHKTHKNKYLDFSKHSYLIAIYHDKSVYLVIIKSTQNGLTEYAIVRSLGHAAQGLRVFYVLPTFDLVKRLRDERFTKSIQNTQYYKALVKAAKEKEEIKQTESVKSIDIGPGNIALVNSFSEIGFTEYAADEVIIDELDRCDQKNILMAPERLSASDYRWQLHLSNPTYIDYGIDADFKETDKKEWIIKCPIGHWLRLNWFKHVVRQTDDNQYVIRDPDWTWESGRDIYPICHKCDRAVDRYNQGVWLPYAPENNKKSGYRLTKLFSGTVPYTDLVDNFNRGLVNPEMMQRFYNADLGEAYTADGAKIDELMLYGCIKDYLMPDMLIDGVSVIGVDVGNMFHIIVGQIIEKRLHIVFIGAVKDPADVIDICRRYRVRAGIIDALPEKRISRGICDTISGLFMCIYGKTRRDMVDPHSKVVTVDRTSAMDNVKESILLKNIDLPKNAKNLPEFYDHIKAPTRVYNPDANNGEGGYEWIEGSKPDHLFHAMGYCLMAHKLLLMLSR